MVYSVRQTEHYLPLMDYRMLLLTLYINVAVSVAEHDLLMRTFAEMSYRVII